MPSDKVSVKYKVEAKGPLADKAEAAMGKAIEAAVKASGVLTNDKPSGTKEPYWSVELSVTLTPDKDGKLLQGKLSGMVLAVNATISGAKLSGSSATEITGKDKKPNAGEVEAVADDLAKKIMQKNAVPYMKSTKLQ